MTRGDLPMKLMTKLCVLVALATVAGGAHAATLRTVTGGVAQ